MECNRESAASVEADAERLIPFRAVEMAAEFADILIQNHQIPFLSFGTLLGKTKTWRFYNISIPGWYRDCGLIAHTQDIDFNVFASEYDSSIENAFANHPEFKLKHRIGKREYSVEYTFTLHHNVPGYNATPVDVNLRILQFRYIYFLDFLFIQSQ